ncbi:MAG TPA: radical SAM protein [Armatimonadota bacterium]|nr:radical SAM protein [Armatimonadota bacterium]
MIGFTRLMCNMGTVSAEISYAEDAEAKAAHEVRELHFSSDLRPLVVWNVTRRCNLRCSHCYLDATSAAAAGELTTAEARAMIADLAEMGAPVLLFSGGEPLLRDDIFELAPYAAAKGVRPVLSTNGVLITDEVAQRIRAAGFQYAGISIDGTEEHHDRFRGAPGAWRRSWEGLERCLKHGVRGGVRFTLTRDNADQLPAVLEETVRRGVPRFCMYHLVYAGRGAAMAAQDVPVSKKRAVVEWLADRARELGERGVELEILTTDNHADGIYLWQRIAAAGGDGDEVMDLLRRHGGCSAGRKFANVGPTGDVHPCQFWTHVSLGNIRQRRFSEIWNDDSSLIGQLRARDTLLGGKCGRCRFQEVCGGCRVRAQAITGDVWAQDPACYLSEEETAR